MDKQPENAESIYKQNLVENSSVPRLSLMLYERMLQILKALSLASDLSIKKKGLTQVHQMLSHLIQVYGQSNDSAYLNLLQSHEALAQIVSQAFQQPQQADIQSLIKQIQDFRRAWSQELSIKTRKTREYPGLNVRPYID